MNILRVTTEATQLNNEYIHFLSFKFTNISVFLLKKDKKCGTFSLEQQHREMELYFL